MADYNPILDTELEPGKPITENLMLRIRDNPIAISEGSLGAPRNQTDSYEDESVTEPKMADDSVANRAMTNDAIGQAEMQNGAVGQNELKTDTGNQFFQLTGTGPIAFRAFLPAGQYGYYPETWFENSTGNSGTLVLSMIAAVATNLIHTEYRARIGILRFNGGSGGTNLQTDCNIRQRFSIASPPFNIGDGDIDNFTFVKINSSGKVVAAWSASVPPWAYNGPTDIKPDLVLKSYGGALKKFKRVIVERPVPPWEGGCEKRYVAGPGKKLKEIDHEMKNKDMTLIPHPWELDALDKDSIVLLDPCGMADHFNMINNNEESVSRLINQGNIVIKDEVAGNAPPGVKIVKCAWKNTGG